MRAREDPPSGGLHGQARACCWPTHGERSQGSEVMGRAVENRQPPPLNQPLLTNSTTGVRSSPWRCIAAGEARRKSWWLPARSCCYLQPLPRAATPATSPRSYRRPLLRHAADGHTPAICCVDSDVDLLKKIHIMMEVMLLK